MSQETRPSERPRPDAAPGNDNADVDSGSRQRAGGIFISYKREDQLYAETLHKFLSQAGYHVWFDKKLQTGGAWELELDRQVMLAGCVIVLWSKRSAESTWVRHEASAAMGRDRYLPITIEKMEVPDPFGRIHAADLVGWDGSPDHPGFRALLNSLEDKLGYPAQSYELTPEKRERPWPKRAPRHPLRQIAEWFKQNMAILIAVAALGGLTYLVFETRSLGFETRQAVSDLEKQVGAVKVLLTTTSEALARQRAAFQESAREVEATNLVLTENAAELGARLTDLQKFVALQQTNALSKSDQSARNIMNAISAQKPQPIVEDRSTRVDAFEVELAIEMDPLALKTADGQNVLPGALTELLLEAGAEKRKLEDERFAQVVGALEQRQVDVKEALVRSWGLDIALERSADAQGRKPAISKRFQGANAVEFAIEPVRGDDGEKTVVRCTLIYRVPTRGAAAFRTYEDFRGAHLIAKLSAVPGSFALKGAKFYPVGYANDNFDVPQDKLHQPTNEQPTIVVEAHIPDDYMLPASPKKLEESSAAPSPDPSK